MPSNQWSLPRRRDHIRQLRTSNTALGKYPVEFQGQLQYIDIYIVDIDFPCYRLANGRTQAAQREFVVQKDLPDNYFTVDPDSMSALQSQDDILRGMVKDAGLFDIFKRDRQTSPLILDNEGYVINGNRRLCAMKMLLQEDSVQYSHFQRVQVVILPPCSPHDIDELEARLQIRPEGRAEYTWVDRAIMFRVRRQHGWTDEQLANLYDLRPVDIRTQIAMLEDAEQYLIERGLKERYSVVARQEYGFQQLQKGRNKCEDDEAKKQLFTQISYVMLDDATGGRLYESIPDALKFLDNVADQISVDFKDTLEKQLGQDSGDNSLDLLGGDRESKYANIVTFLRNSDNSTEARNTIRDKLEEMRNDERERRDTFFCLREIQRAYSKLQNAKNALNEDAATEGIEALLANIESVVVDIRGLI